MSWTRRFSWRGGQPTPAQPHMDRAFWLALFQQEAGVENFFALSKDGDWRVLIGKEVRVDTGVVWSTKPSPPRVINVAALAKMDWSVTNSTLTQSWVQFPADWELAPEGFADQLPHDYLHGRTVIPIRDGQGYVRGAIELVPMPWADRHLGLVLHHRFAKQGLVRTNLNLEVMRIEDRKNERIAAQTYMWRRHKPREERIAEGERRIRKWFERRYPGGPDWENPFWGWNLP
jgi:hypothetical protein